MSERIISYQCFKCLQITELPESAWFVCKLCGHNEYKIDENHIIRNPKPSN